jgi:hypothetical protein
VLAVVGLAALSTVRETNAGCRGLGYR